MDGGPKGSPFGQNMIPQKTAFGIPDFRRLTIMRFLFAFAMQMQAVVMGWQMYELKHDPLALGLIGLAEAIPAIGLALYAGDIVDRGNPLKIYRGVIATSLTSALLLVAVSTGALGPASANWIYAAAFITGLARGFSSPAIYSLVPQIVPREILNVSAAWITSAFQVASVAGPAAAGLLYAWKGPELPYVIDALMLGGGLLLLAFVEHKPHPPKALVEGEPIFSRITSGLKFVFNHELLLAALAMDMFAVLFGGVTAILPIFAAEILRTGPTGLGLLRAAPSFGAAAVSLLLVRFPISRHAGRILLSVVTGFGLCMVGFGLSRSFLLSLTLLAVGGALDSASMVIRGAIVQLCSPEDMRGRIASVNSIFIGSSNEIGEFESGVAAKLLGTVPSVVFGGAMTLITVALTTLLAPKLRKMDLSKL